MDTDTEQEAQPAKTLQKVEYGLSGRTIPFLWMGFAFFTIAFWIGRDAVSDAHARLGRWGWGKTTCQILASNVLTQRAAGGPARFRFEVRYRYEWNNQSYESGSHDLGDEGFSHYKDAKRLTRRYKVGEKTVCRVNPADPSQAVLQQDAFPIVPGIVGTLLLVLYGVLVTRAAFRKPKPGSHKKDRKKDKEGKSAEQEPTVTGKILAVTVFIWWICFLMAIPLVGFRTVLGMLLLCPGFVVGPSLAFWLIGTRLGIYKEETKEPGGPESDTGSASSREQLSPIHRPIEVVIIVGALTIYALLVRSMVQNARILDFESGLLLALQIAWFFMLALPVSFFLLFTVSFFPELASGDREVGFSASKDSQAGSIASKFLAFLFVASLLFTFAALAVVFAFPARKMTGGTRMSSGLRFPLSQVRDIAVDSQGRMYCISSRYKRVQVYSPEQRFVRGWFTDASGDSRLTIDDNDRLHVYTKDQHQTFDADGLLLDQGALSEEEVAEVRKREERDVSVDPAGNRYEIGGSKWFPSIVKVSSDGTESVVVRDPWYVWILAFPRPSGAAMIAAVLSIVLTGITRKGKSRTLSGWGKPGRKDAPKQEGETDQAEKDRVVNETVQPDQQ